MKKLNGTEMKALFILSIVVPIGLLTTFRLTGILEGPASISQTITLDTINWEFQRPDHYIMIDDELNATYISGASLSNLHVWVVDYIDRSQFLADHDQIRLVFVMNSTSTTTNSFIESVDILVNKDQQSLADWSETELYSRNLSLVELVEGYRGSTKAYIKLTNVNHSPVVYFSAEINWFLLTTDTQTHQLEIFFELIYYDGTANNGIIQPFQLRIVGR